MDDWEKGENISAKFFGFIPTSGSGRGSDKSDSKDQDYRCETKTYHLPTKSFAVNHEKFAEWRRNASRLGHNFMLHILPYEGNKPLLEYSTVTIDARLFKNMKNRLDELEKLVVELEHELGMINES